MLIKKKMIVYVSRQNNLTDTLYTHGIDVSSDGSSIAFHLDFSVNLRTRHQINQKDDTESLELDLKSSRKPSELVVNLDNRQSFDAVYKSFKNFIDLYDLQRPVICFVNITAINCYRLRCAIESDERHSQLMLNITE